MQIKIKKEGVESGPFTRDEVSRMLADGRINKTDLAFSDGFSNWLPVVAVLTPRTTPPPFNDAAHSFANSRVKPNETISNIISQTSAIDWTTVVPFAGMIKDKPWNIRWVRWFLWFIGTTLLLQRLNDGNDISKDQTIFLIALNWCLAWGMAVAFIIKPDKTHSLVLTTLVLPSVLLLVIILTMAGKVSFVNDIYRATTDNSFLKRVGAILVIVFAQQVIQTAPFAYVYQKRKRMDSASTIIFYGAIAGFAMGLTPALTTLIHQKWNTLAGLSIGIFESQTLLALFTLPILNGFWGAIMGNFVANCVKNDKAAYGWLIVAVLVPTIMASLFLATTSLILSFAVVIVSILSLSIYLQTHKQS